MLSEKAENPNGKGRNSDATVSGGLTRSSDYTHEMIDEKSIVTKGSADSRAKFANS